MTRVNKKNIATDIVKKLRQYNFQAYFVGGCVRDMLMRKSPKDFDIATDAQPDQVKKIFTEKTLAVGVQFGTLVVVRNGVPFQISTFRGEKDKYSLSILEDVALRDFTINGLIYDPIDKRTIDLVGGKKDIRKKRICAIGNARARFTQDPLRLIRAVRFAVTLGFSIEEKTFQTIRRLVCDRN